MNRILLSLFLVSGMTFYAAAQPGSCSAPQTWSIVASYTIPGKASGLAWDGTYLYFGEYWSNSNQVYRFDPSSATYVLQCTGPFSAAYGLTYKSPNLVTIDQPSSSSQPSQAIEFSLSGTQVSTITLPDHYMSGIAYDAGDYWVCTYYPDPGKVYKINSAGTILSQFVPPNNQPWDICLQGSDLWIADYYGNMLYKVTQTGTLLESHASQAGKPAGVVYDGNYLWYCDGELGGNSTLYKVDLNGSGTPAITVPVTSHNYGTVTIGNSSTWNCLVQNTGTANLIVNEVSIPSGEPVSTSMTFPHTLIPGATLNIPLTYTPVTPSALNTQVNILSSDPIHPQVALTLTGNGVYAGPHIQLSDTLQDYGERRAGAYTRWYLILTNDGSQPLSVSNITNNDPHFLIDGSVSFPIPIATLAQAKIGVWFHPTGGNQFSGEITITSNAVGQNTLTMSLVGTGVDTLYPMGTVLWSTTISTGYDNSPKSIRSIRDITGDGIDDVLVASEDDYIRCFNGNASHTADELWATYISSGAIYDQNSLSTIDDIDNDGYRDVVAGTAWGDRSILALSGKTGQQIWKHNTHEYGGGGWVYQVDAVYDYNGDDFPDVLAATGNDGNGTGPIRVYCLDGKTGVPIWEYPAGGPVFSVIGVEDFTGDGKPDVVAGASNSQETAGRVFGIDGSDGALVWTFIPAGTSVWALLQIDDVNNDGKKDIACGDFAGNINFLNADNGNSLFHMNIGNELILRFESMGDLNNDGHPDFVVGHSGNHAIVINGMDCTTLWSVPVADQSWNVANIGDVSWDGTNDAITGTLYQNNFAYFLDGKNGATLEFLPVSSPVDAIAAIPDIVGDSTREMMIGGREGEVVCISGGYDLSVGIGQDANPRKGNNRLRVYPNPSTDWITVSCEERFTGLRVMDIYGRTVLNFPVTASSLNLDLSSLHEGLYFISAMTSGGCLTGKVVVK